MWYIAFTQCARFRTWIVLLLAIVGWNGMVTSDTNMAAARLKIPRISGAYVNVYRPGGDVFLGPSAGPLEAGRHYDEWVVNDHCFVRDGQGRWHLFGITHPASGLEEVHAGEYQ
ncbi:MAG: hypothetical protein QG656_920, partial [Candidatus Hydrogenedentes bacterium]|nr:hypothetical protein [Candidatus Hydrogenedentota bacterium]